MRSVLPALHGARGVLLAAPADAERIRRALRSAGFAVAEADLDDRPGQGAPHPDDRSDSDGRSSSLRAAQQAVARALRLPETAGRNLDALVDSLRDLASWWPDDRQVVLLLHGADVLVESDLPGWHELTDILGSASTELWRDGGEWDRAFETVALVHRHGVAPLPSDDADGTAAAPGPGEERAGGHQQDPTPEGWPT